MKTIKKFLIILFKNYCYNNFIDIKLVFETKLQILIRFL
jgi:hypothetical protein